jgi:hypothetical protein
MWSNLSIQYKTFIGQYGKNQSNTDIFRIVPIPVSPITTRSESARHFNNFKEKSREILDWLINKGIITWCFSYWPSYRSSVCCIGVRLRLRPIQQASDLWPGQYEKHHVIILYYFIACGSCHHFLDIELLLMRKLLNQGFLVIKLKSPSWIG